jgi:transcriptional regulator with XRE-family HTH domain
MLDPVIKAVRALRQHLDEGQQAFARRLGLSHHAIFNYEKDRRPTGMALASLARAASAAGRQDLVNAFMGALMEELRLAEISIRLMSSAWRAGRPIGLLLAQFDDPEQIEYAWAFSDAIGDLESDSPKIKARARKRLKEFKAAFDSDPERQLPEWALKPGADKTLSHFTHTVPGR